MKNPFSPFPEAPPVRVLLYGDPGTEKTRRCLSQLPGPIAYVDMESGGAYYADLPPKGSGYMLTRSVAEVRSALDYLASPAGKAYRSVVIDPVGIVWDQLQEAYKIKAAERGQRRNPGMTADDVLMDVSAWGKVKAQHGALITRCLNLPQHVVFVARGADTINEKGEITGYKAACEKSVPFLVSTVIQSRHGHDIVEKDRSGALSVGKQPRVDLRVLIGRAGTVAPQLATETEAATHDAAEPDDAPAPSPGRAPQPQPPATPTRGSGVDAAMVTRLRELGLYDDAISAHGPPDGWDRAALIAWVPGAKLAAVPRRWAAAGRSDDLEAKLAPLGMTIATIGKATAEQAAVITGWQVPS